MHRREAIVVLAVWIATAAPASPQALPFCLDPLLANQQVRSPGVALGPDLAVVLKTFPDTLGNALIYRKTGGSWTLEFSLLATGVQADVNKTVANEVALNTVTALRTYDRSAGIWNPRSQVALTSTELVGDFVLEGNILAMLVRPNALALPLGGFTEGSVRLYERAGLGAAWSLVATIRLVPPASTVSVIESMDLDGTRLVVGSSELNLVRVYERDFGGSRNWGNIATIVGDVRGHRALGSSVALDGDRLAATEGAVGPRDLRIVTFSRNTGGTNNWGDTGTLLDTSASESVYGYQLDADGGRIAVLGLPAASSPGLGSFFDPFAGNSLLWVFGPGAAPLGYALEQGRSVGAFNNGLFSGEHLGLCGSDLLLSLTPSTYEGSAQWAVSAYMRNAGGTNKWGLAQLIEGPGAAKELGAALDMSGFSLVAGLPGDDALATDAGAVMLWSNFGLRFQELWIPVGRVENPDPNNGARFGEAVAIVDSGMAAIGAPGHLGQRGGVWLVESGFLFQSNPILIIPPLFPDPGDRFGASLAATETFLAVGAPGDDDAGPDAGAVYLFERDLGGADNWGLRKKILRPAGTSGTGFASSLGMGAATTVIGGDPFLVAATPGGPGQTGKVFLFAKDAGGADNWGSGTGFSAPAGGPRGYGAAMDAGNASVLVGAPGAPGDPGEAYLYRNLPPVGWTLFRTVGGTPGVDPSFGSSVAIADPLLLEPSASIVVGAPGQGVGGSFSAYGFRGPGGSDWGLLATKAGAAGDQLGTSVAGSLIYFAGGAPNANGTGAGTGRIDAFRAGCYEIWAYNQGPAFASAWLPWEDADLDHGANIVEFALNTGPLDPGEVPNLEMALGLYNDGGGNVPALFWDRPLYPYCTDLLQIEFDASTNLSAWVDVVPRMQAGLPDRRFFPLGGTAIYYRLEARYPALPPRPGGGPILIIGE